MEKPYDIKDLGKRLKDAGLVQAEDLAGDIYFHLKAWLGDSAALSENKMDDLAMPFLNQLDPIVMEQIDKIDGAKG